MAMHETGGIVYMHDPTSQRQIACMATEEEEMMQLVDLDEKLIDRHLSPGRVLGHERHHPVCLGAHRILVSH